MLQNIFTELFKHEETYRCGYCALTLENAASIERFLLSNSKN